MKLLFGSYIMIMPNVFLIIVVRKTAVNNYESSNRTWNFLVKDSDFSYGSRRIWNEVKSLLWNEVSRTEWNYFEGRRENRSGKDQQITGIREYKSQEYNLYGKCGQVSQYRQLPNKFILFWANGWIVVFNSSEVSPVQLICLD